MAATVTGVMINDGRGIIYEQDFRDFIETNLQYIINHRSTISTRIKHDIAFKCRGDFYKVMFSLNVEPEFHWVNLRINNMTSPMEYKGEVEDLDILLVSLEVLNDLIQSYRLKSKLKNKK